ncbi:unnamed protein product [Blepharisma stoltei]|uniref:Calcium-dependent protein kinase 1 n=1 Tax=Blepharisma stoltei TaxID=1481888 RepID=A0AAU9IMI7_9CILI|nr:unnamed protein product [Blepharisma stoltei]
MGCCLSDRSLDDKNKKTKASDDKRKNTKETRLQRNSSTKGLNKGSFVKSSKSSVHKNYEMIRTVGEGGFGKVYVVKDKRTSAIKAMKEIPKINVDNNKKVDEEIDILKELDHPNIMKIYEVYESSKSYYIISEFISGGELFDKIIAAKYISEKLAAKYLHDIMGAINYCHSRGIVHRDLKPENLLLDSKDENANIKIIDFGISERLKSDAKLRETIGTLYYMAPEVVKGEYDQKCDVWSAGVILYIMLCGRPPFYGNSNLELIKCIKKGPKMTDKIWNSISAEVKDLIHKMLAVEPADRLSAADVLAHPWMSSYINNTIVDTKISLDALSNLGTFRAGNKLEKSILTFITSQVFGEKEEAELAELFKALDANGDGKLSQEELLNGYHQLKWSSPEEVKEIMKKCDTDGSGFIDFTEFITAATNWNQILQKEQLISAFKMYDTSGDGQLSLDELKNGIPGIKDSEWAEFLNEADKDGDGNISLEELKEYLTKKVLV